MTISHAISTSFGWQAFAPLLTYREAQREDYEFDRQGAFSYVAKFTLIEAGFLTLSALCVAGTVVRLIISFGLYAYDKISGDSNLLTRRSFQVVLQTGVLSVVSLHMAIAHLFLEDLRPSMTSLRNVLLST